MNKNHKIAIVGLGYVGLPLAVAFSAQYPTLGYDINPKRIDELKSFKDSTLETTTEELKQAKQLSASNFTTIPLKLSIIGSIVICILRIIER